MSKFKNGDLVNISKDYIDLLKKHFDKDLPDTAIVHCYNEEDGDYSVVMGGFEGHSCFGSIPGANGWFIPAEFLEKI